MVEHLFQYFYEQFKQIMLPFLCVLFFSQFLFIGLCLCYFLFFYKFFLIMFSTHDTLFL